MKIPKYIDKALHKRTSSACKLLKYDEIVTNFIDKHHIGVDLKIMMVAVKCSLIHMTANKQSDKQY